MFLLIVPQILTALAFNNNSVNAVIFTGSNLMREIQKDILLNFVNSLSSSVVCENIIHVLFQRFGKERDVDIVTDEEENHDEERVCDSG